MKLNVHQSIHTKINKVTWHENITNCVLVWLLCVNNYFPGPQRWEDSWAPAAKGLHQSPINIESVKAVYDKSICNGPLNLHYVPADCRCLTNNGHSIQITLEQRLSGHIDYVNWIFKNRIKVWLCNLN